MYKNLSYELFRNFIQQSPREVNSLLTSQEMSHLLWNTWIHYSVHKRLPGLYLEPIESNPHPS
jgi:hypothetical protein